MRKKAFAPAPLPEDLKSSIVTSGAAVERVTLEWLCDTFDNTGGSQLKHFMSFILLVSLCAACGDNDSSFTDNIYTESTTTDIPTASANAKTPFSVIGDNAHGISSAIQHSTLATAPAVEVTSVNQTNSVNEISDLPLTSVTMAMSSSTLPLNNNNAISSTSMIIGGGSSGDENDGALQETEDVLFSRIKEKGLPNACYLDEDHYVAEYLYQNPDVCFWSVDSKNKKVRPIEIPVPPSDVVHLPAPSGGNDTAILEKIINANSGGSVVGNGTYKVGNLNINVPIDIFYMPMVTTENAKDIVKINAPDVRIFGSPIDGNGSNTAVSGFVVNTGSHRFTLVNSGYSNVHHTKQTSFAGVMIWGVDDFHIACNTFENLLNDTGDKSLTARANAIWMNGRNKESTSGGVVANNVATNHQSNGARKDSEFFAIQGYTTTSQKKPVRLFANRATNAGKRFSKHQESNAKVLSNENYWPVKDGPLGKRALLAVFAVHFSNNVLVRNNRVKIGANGYFDNVFSTDVGFGDITQDNIHFDCNDIEITDQLDPSSPYSSLIIAARMSSKGGSTTGNEATNSSANNNHVYGQGSVRFHYWFGEGYVDDGGIYETKGNVFDIPYLSAEYKNP
ncbi:MAG: hypothetical protein V3U76_06130 [Granulosicoccus sp.]